MKTASKYIEEKVTELSEKYDHSFSAAYEYDASIETFFVEIRSEGLYEQRSFKEELADIILAFDEIHPDYNLAFISHADEFIELENPIVIVRSLYEFITLHYIETSYDISSWELDLPHTLIAESQLNDLIEDCPSVSEASETWIAYEESSPFGKKKDKEDNLSLAA